MTNTSGNSMDAVANLLLERQRYEQWISSLDAKRAVTPPNVFERVRADYERRLNEVIAQISGRTSEVQALIASLTDRLGRLQAEETALRDERYEAELRAAVGEYKPDQWSEVVRTSDERIGRVSAERATVSADLARLHQILSVAGAASVGSAPVPAALGQPTAGQSGAPASAGKKSGFDELEFLQSVVGKEKTQEQAAASGPLAGLPIMMPTAPPAPSAPPAAPAQSTPAPPAGFASGSHLDGSVPLPTQASTPAGDPAGTGRPPEPIAEEAQRAAQEAGVVPSYLKDVPQEQVKTLKCLACSTMNLPTEWYCENCGGELAAL